MPKGVMPKGDQKRRKTKAKTTVLSLKEGRDSRSQAPAGQKAALVL
jgi:hypothetical protein